MQENGIPGRGNGQGEGPKVGVFLGLFWNCRGQWGWSGAGKGKSSRREMEGNGGYWGGAVGSRGAQGFLAFAWRVKWEPLQELEFRMDTVYVPAGSSRLLGGKRPQKRPG